MRRAVRGLPGDGTWATYLKVWLHLFANLLGDLVLFHRFTLDIITNTRDDGVLAIPTSAAGHRKGRDAALSAGRDHDEPAGPAGPTLSKSQPPPLDREYPRPHPPPFAHAIHRRRYSLWRSRPACQSGAGVLCLATKRSERDPQPSIPEHITRHPLAARVDMRGEGAKHTPSRAIIVAAMMAPWRGSQAAPSLVSSCSNRSTVDSSATCTHHEETSKTGWV